MIFVKILCIIFCLISFYRSAGQTHSPIELDLTNDGGSLFIENPKDTINNDPCIYRISMNNRVVLMNYQSRNFQLDYNVSDRGEMVHIEIMHYNTCMPKISKYDNFLILDYTTLKNGKIEFEPRPDLRGSSYVLEYLEDGIWKVYKKIESNETGKYISSIKQLMKNSKSIRLVYHAKDGRVIYQEIDLIYGVSKTLRIDN